MSGPQTETEERGGYLSPIGTKRLLPHHRKMARMLVNGMRPGEIAKAVGLSNTQVSRVQGSPVFQKYLEQLYEKAELKDYDAGNIIRENAAKAAAVLVEDLYQDVDESEKARYTRQSAAKEILDRSGFCKTSDLKANKELNLTQVNINKMDPKELFDEVMGMIEGK